MDLDVVLSSEALVSQLALVMDPLGFTKRDIPSIKVYAGMSLDSLHHLADWALEESVTRPNQTVYYALNQMEHCRLLRFSLRLSHPHSRLSTSTLALTEAFLHLGKVRVFGHPVSSFCVPNSK